MDLSDISRRLGLSESKPLIRKAAELRRLSDIQFDSSVIGVGEVCKAIICLEIAAARSEVIFDRQAAIRLSGMSEKAYNRSFNAMQNGIGIKKTLDIRELGIRFGCIRLIPFVKKSLSLYKDRFLASLPASRRASADFTRPIFTAVAFYLCGKRHKDLCHDVIGISKEKKDPRDVKGNRELLDALPEKRRLDDGGYMSGDELPNSRKRKRMEKVAYDDWKSKVLSSNKQSKTKVLGKRTIQSPLNFQKNASETRGLEA